MSRTCSIDAAVDHLLQTIEGPIRMGLPLGLGKPNRLVNALYQRLRTLPERQLTLYTALSLGRPAAGGDLQRRFLEPFAERVFADYPELDYLHALRRDELPANIRVEEFYLQPGSLLDSAPAQQHYISCNYSHVARDINAKGVNAVAQLVARHPERPGKLSLACNPDITLDLLPMLEKRRAAGETIVAIGVVHDDLPYLPGDAEVEESVFDLLIDAPAESSRLFSTPNMPVNLQDHCIGLHASALVRDGGTLQIGIGSMGDALTAALLLRQRDNATYRALIDELGVRARWAETVERDGGLEPFRRGLYGCSEMFVPGLLALAEAGVLSRRVYPDEARQRAAERGEAPEEGGCGCTAAFPRSVGVLPAPARDVAGRARRDRHDRHRLRQQPVPPGRAEASAAARRALHQQRLHRDPARRRGRRPAGGRPGAQWRRRAVQLRRPGSRAGGRTFDPDAA